MKNEVLILTLFALVIHTNLFAQDPPRKSDKTGSGDYPGISRYEGAVIQEYQVINYTDFYLGLGEPVEKDFAGHGKFFKKSITVKGKLFNIQYLIPIQEGVLKLYENYNNALKLANYNILYVEHNKNSCFYSEDYYGGDAGPLTKQTRDFYGVKCDKDYYYVVAKGVRDSLDIYLALYICPGGNYGQDFVIVNQSVIEAVPLELGLVKADNIAQNIRFTGHSIFYDIHFATGSDKIEESSNAQIKEIASYIQANPNKKYFIVGHTDNVGDFASNITLSENRAKNVMNELISKYNVDANQLKAYGVANLSPVTSNNTDKGKARNRRVEIVEQ